ncbi:hypothetical protein CURE108131_16850 [Cupriavidus respiraculi]|uniref:DUF1453 domain-containing protein n=1 Tax=Cupriavidus respiraculi TaxID=195930 RepID=A0ABM8WKI8_9BURK|nr:hypothetical protein [Cupriavidus respiraculi]CAG9167892.1 hypothetical protein LMG21510_00890 [Cupriavidus respiraculi]
MTVPQILVIVALCIYAVYRQTVRNELKGKSRFKLALIYGIVGLAVGGFFLPSSPTSWAILLGGVVLSAMIGYARGKLTRVWEEDGRLYSQGTPLTIALFLLLILAKFAAGTVEYLTGTSQHGGFGEVMLLIAIMVAFQAEIVWRRALALRGERPFHDGMRADPDAFG